MKRMLVAGGLSLALMIPFASVAFAQDAGAIANGLLDLACSAGGRVTVLMLLVPACAYVIGLAANFRSRLPAGAVLALDMIGGNFAKSFRSKLLPLFLLIGALNACAGATPKPAGDIPADVQVYVTYAQATNSKLHADIAKEGPIVAANALRIGNDACGAAEVLHTIYTGPLGQLAIVLGGAAISSATGAPPIAAAAADATEAVVYKEVQASCVVIAAANAGSVVTPDTIAAVKTLLADVPKLHGAIAKISPAAAKLLDPAA